MTRKYDIEDIASFVRRYYQSVVNPMIEVVVDEKPECIGLHLFRIEVLFRSYSLKVVVRKVIEVTPIRNDRMLIEELNLETGRISILDLQMDEEERFTIVH